MPTVAECKPSLITKGTDKAATVIRVSTQSKFAGLLRAEVKNNRGSIKIGDGYLYLCKW